MPESSLSKLSRCAFEWSNCPPYPLPQVYSCHSSVIASVWRSLQQTFFTFKFFFENDSIVLGVDSSSNSPCQRRPPSPWLHKYRSLWSEIAMEWSYPHETAITFWIFLTLVGWITDIGTIIANAKLFLCVIFPCKNISFSCDSKRMFIPSSNFLHNIILATNSNSLVNSFKIIFHFVKLHIWNFSRAKLSMSVCTHI